MVSYLEIRLVDLTSLLLEQQETILDQPWAWGSYDSEGIRFGILRILEELESLAARETAAADPTETALIFSGACEAYRELQAVLLNVDVETSENAPADGEWDVRTAYAHIVAADLGFYGVAAFALEQHRAGIWVPEAKMTEETWDRLLDMDEESYDAMLQSNLDALKEVHARWHARITALFGGISDRDLDLPSRYWEDETLNLRFRLGRFASHLRQHTIQIEKTLAALGQYPGEIDRLVRRLFRIYGRGEPFFRPESSEGVISLVDEVSGAIRAQGS